VRFGGMDCGEAAGKRYGGCAYHDSNDNGPELIALEQPHEDAVGVEAPIHR
jgi:hypothetical protein